MNRQELRAFFISQLNDWPEVAKRYRQLGEMQVKYLREKKWKKYRVIYNPSRAISVTAEPTSVVQTKCPLCKGNRPDEQSLLRYAGKYNVLVNPYPIFNRHFTIVSNRHQPQQITDCIADMFKLARDLTGYTVYYNGPGAGASVPEHLHIQMASTDELPLRQEFKIWKSEKVLRHRETELRLVRLPKSFLLRATDMDEALRFFDMLYNALNEKEKRMNNVLVCYERGTWYATIYIRRKHRPDAYFFDPPEKLTVSPGAVEMESVIVAIDLEEMEQLTKPMWEEILEELTITPERAGQIVEEIKSQKQPYDVQVGIIEAPIVDFDLHSSFLVNGEPVTGPQTVCFSKDRIFYNGKHYNELLFTPVDKDIARIEVSRVVIGKDFHWQEEQTQIFSGSWRVIPKEGNVIGINILNMEEYLKSVVSSEMSANAPVELLKAHAIIARTWLIRMIERDAPKRKTKHEPGLIWHEAEEHKHYDVCADDHCQRYQGVTRITNPEAVKAVDATRGIVITHQGEVIDARYSKCCGGITEEFGTAWGNADYPYLVRTRDVANNWRMPHSWIDNHIDSWVTQAHPAWCNVTDPAVIGSIMNDFDLKTTDFYRWTVTYTQEELAGIIRTKTGIDPGEILSIEPIRRGPSGRLWIIKINGSLNSWVVGKELEIRRILSPTHLYSSAFTIETEKNVAGSVSRFFLHGAGWGHGVGLCQIGAANMAAHGYSFQEIIQHYYRKIEITKIYM